MGGVDNPLLMCQVGIPLAGNEYPYAGKKPNPVDTWDVWTKTPVQAPEERQELELLGSSKAHYCVKFHCQPSGQHLTHLDLIRSTYRKDLTPFNKNYTPPNWCNLHQAYNFILTPSQSAAPGHVSYLWRLSMGRDPLRPPRGSL